MTPATENQPKKIPDLNIFLQGPGGEKVRVGTVFKHAKGDGITILMGNTRYVAFPPKAKATSNLENGA